MRFRLRPLPGNGRDRRARRRVLAVASLALIAWSCASREPAPAPRAPARVATDPPWHPGDWTWRAAPRPLPERVAEDTPEPRRAKIEPAPVAGPGEVLVYRDGEPVDVVARSDAEAAGLLILDVGSEWVPMLFRSAPEAPHQYERVFIALANGHFDDGPEGRRAAQERYLEPHGIPPSIALLQRRFKTLAERPCTSQVGLPALQELEAVVWEEEGEPPPVPEGFVTALQARLACEGHLRSPPSGELDEATRSALQEFERRNRIYALGSLEGETLDALRTEPLELERRTLLRVLTERVVLDLGVIEDASALDVVPARRNLRVENAPNVVRRIEERVLEAFGLQTVAGVQRFYDRLERVLASPHYEIAIEPVELPEYYADDMDLWVEIDRGDLYYEFPFDESGAPLDFEIERGPSLTLFAQDGARVRPLAHYQTTIGGWRVRRYHRTVYWQYEESPVGTRAWRRIVTAPVWLPPRSTPTETLMAKFRRTSDGSEFHELNQNLVGPSFASAYGLVAAYHQRVARNENGVLVLGRDDGIRTHGSSDYTSIGRTVSSGCHRLRNHLAVRLFSFVLTHRAHRQLGHLPTRYRLRVRTPEIEDGIDVTLTGYELRLERPLEVQVLPGRIRGELKHAVHRRIPATEDALAWPMVSVSPNEGRAGRTAPGMLPREPREE